MFYEGFVFGRRASGYFDVRTLGGKKLSPAIHAKKLMLLEKKENLFNRIKTGERRFLPCLKTEVSAPNVL